MSDKHDKTEAPTQGYEERIRELQERAAEAAGGEIHMYSSGDAPPEVLEQFWKNVVAYEEADSTTPLDVLTRGGLKLPPAEELDDEALSAKLNDLFHAMALHNMYLHHTDHLSDRELYVRLREDSLREHMMMPMGENGPLGNWHIDLIGSGSEEDVYVDLKYYASEEDRRDWAERWPEDEIPEHAELPYDRDRTLPSPADLIGPVDD